MSDTYINLSNLSKFKTLITTYIGNAVSTGVADSIKSGILYNDTAYFFTTSNPPASASDYESESVFSFGLSSSDVTALQQALGSGFDSTHTVAAAVSANANAISAINDASTGILATAEGYTDTAITNLGLGTAAQQDAASTAIVANDQRTDLVSAAQVSAFVADVISSINEFEYEAVSTLPTASASTMYKIYLVPNSGSGTNVKDEYITIRSGSEGSYTYAWELLGTTEIDLTNYVQKTLTIAGLNLSADITKAALLTALGVVEGANVNVIDAVDTNNFAINTTGNVLGLASGKQLMTTAQGTKLDAIAVNTSANSVTDGTNTLSNIVSDSSYAHITVSASGVSDGTNTFAPTFATDAQIEALFS